MVVPHTHFTDRFIDRQHAGKLLVSKLQKFRGTNAIVLALPRGGVIVGAEIATHLNLPLEVLVIRKLGAPLNPELAVGAITEVGDLYLNPDIIHHNVISDAQLDEVIRREMQELVRRIKAYRKGQNLPDLAGRPVIVVDDGIATGATVFAAIKTIKRFKQTRIIVATPVCAADTAEKLTPKVDELVCLTQPNDLGAIGRYYETFEQVGDDTVENLLRRI